MRFSLQVIASVALFAVAGMPLESAWMNAADLRLGVGAQDAHLVPSSTANIGRHADENWRSQLKFINGTLGMNGGWIWDVGVALSHVALDAGSRWVHVTTPTIDVQAGYGYAFAAGFHVELTPFVSHQRSSCYNIADKKPSSVKEWDPHYEYGATLGA